MREQNITLHVLILGAMVALCGIMLLMGPPTYS